MWLDTPSQRGGVGSIPRPRPLGDINAAMRDLDLGADGVRALVDEGKLIAFNISARPGGSVTMRILTASLQFYQTTGRRLDLDWPTTVSLILPIEREHILGIELERCLNCDRGQAVRERLKGIAATGSIFVSGNETNAYALPQLPARLLADLVTEATKQNCADVATLLSMPAKRWQPSLPLPKVCQADLARARKLRDVLLPWLIGQHSSKVTELEEQAARNYKRIFGHEISARHLRDLFTRTIRRDGGREDWNDLAIYLADRLKRLDVPIKATALDGEFSTMLDAIKLMPGRNDLSGGISEAVWGLALGTYKELLNRGETAKRATRRVRSFLFEHAPFLAPSRPALWATFARRIEALNKVGGEISEVRDGRQDNGDEVELTVEDIRLLRHAAATKTSGRIDTAWRMPPASFWKDESQGKGRA